MQDTLYRPALSEQIRQEHSMRPPRPSHRDTEVLNIAVQSLMPQVVEWCGDRTPNLVALQKTLHKVMSRCGAINSYELAKIMDEDRYEPDIQLIEILDNAYGERTKARDALVAQWVTAYNVQPRHSVNQLVRVSIQRFADRTTPPPPAVADGTILEIDTVHAIYLINVPALGHVPPGQIGTNGFFIDYEDVV